MTVREAVRILMMSPIYFQLDLETRMEMVKEFCRIHQPATAD
jgi:hypothetical protein